MVTASSDWPALMRAMLAKPAPTSALVRVPLLLNISAMPAVTGYQVPPGDPLRILSSFGWACAEPMAMVNAATPMAARKESLLIVVDAFMILSSNVPKFLVILNLWWDGSRD